MNPRHALLERRKQYLSARIAAQRNQLGAEFEAFRGPLHAFEVARGVGETLRRHAPLIGGIVAVVGWGAMRGGLLSKSFRAFRFATRASRWLGMARVAMQVAQRVQRVRAGHA